jgi:hypothetical protein
MTPAKPASQTPQKTIVNSCDTRMPQTLVHAGADHRAEARAIEEGPQRDGEDHRDQADGQPVRAEAEAERGGRSAQGGRGGDADRVPRPHHEAHVRDHEREAERDEHLGQLGAGQPAQDEPLHDPPEEGDPEPAQDGRRPEIDAAADRWSRGTPRA